MTLNEIPGINFSQIQIDNDTLIKLGLNTQNNSLCISAAAPFAFCGFEDRKKQANDVWHSHFKHLILAMPGLIEAAAAMCDACNKYNLTEIVPEYTKLADALEPYKNVI